MVAEARPDLIEQVGVEARCQTGEVAVGRGDQEHRRLARVGQRCGRPVVAVGVVRADAPAHRRDRDLGAGGGAERPIDGALGVELVDPVRLEVDGVDEDQAGQLVDRPLREQIDDPLLGGRFDPVVDGDAGGIRLLDEVDRPQARAVVAGEQVDEVVPERVPGLAPDAVGDRELEGIETRYHVALAEQLLVEGVARRVPRLVVGGPQHRGHLRRGLALGAGQRHRERHADAVGGEEQVGLGVVGDQLAVQVEGELGVAVDERRHAGGVGRRPLDVGSDLDDLSCCHLASSRSVGGVPAASSAAIVVTAAPRRQQCQHHQDACPPHLRHPSSSPALADLLCRLDDRDACPVPIVAPTAGAPSGRRGG